MLPSDTKQNKSETFVIDVNISVELRIPTIFGALSLSVVKTFQNVFIADFDCSYIYKIQSARRPREQTSIRAFFPFFFPLQLSENY